MITTMEQMDSITIKGEEVPVTLCTLPVADLQFYPENPRIYSMVCEAGREPAQEEIFRRLIGMQHVKELIRSIKQNKGLREPIIVRNYCVLEGNSRLAAYKQLSENNIEFAVIKCKVLPDHIGDDVVFAILADHISGKKDWQPYEQAGYLYRRHKLHNVPIERIADDMGLTKPKVLSLINVYQFMIDVKERDINKWSYYDVYVNSHIAAKAKAKYDGLDRAIVKTIKSGELPTALDFRGKLKVFLSSRSANIKKFIEGERSFEGSFESAANSGYGDHGYKRLHKFRNWIVDPDAQKRIIDTDGEAKNKCKFELTKIRDASNKILKRL